MKLMKNSFKIIAIKPLEKCFGKHKKVLKNNTIYYFYQDYFIKHLRVENETITFKENTPIDLFNNNNLNINISAIVGKNGSGKSTIVELLFKAINNIAFNFKEEKTSKQIRKRSKSDEPILTDYNRFIFHLAGI